MMQLIALYGSKISRCWQIVTGLSYLAKHTRLDGNHWVVPIPLNRALEKQRELGEKAEQTGHLFSQEPSHLIHFQFLSCLKWEE